MVVELQEYTSEVALLIMRDRDHKNTFSPGIVSGLREGFDTIRDNTLYKIVVLTGYDNYFSTGGTKEALVALQQGIGTFEDGDIYQLALDCSIPVISAMQGHGVGGGFVLGLFSDIVVLGRESVYATNFMNYGFTPGMGATYILAEKLGNSLAREMLFSARNFRGAELEKRGIPFAVLPRAEVLPYALESAKEMAKMPRLSLITLKQHLNRHIRAALPDVIKEELRMHALTMHQPDVLDRINARFGN